MESSIIGAIIAAVPVLFSPLVVWFVGRVGMGRRFREVELRIKQLELLEKAASLSRTGTEENEQVRKSIENAISNTVLYLRVQEEERQGYASLSWARRALLLFKPFSRKGWVYRVLYYLNLYGLLVLPVIFISFYQTGKLKKPDLPVMILGILIYLILAIVFHRLAVSDAKKYEKNTKSPANK